MKFLYHSKKIRSGIGEIGPYSGLDKTTKDSRDHIPAVFYGFRKILEEVSYAEKHVPGVV